MKPVRSLALLLLACTLVGMGFFLPWLGAAWQDAAMEQTTTQYEVTPLLDNDLSSHLKLVANGYTVFALSEASPGCPLPRRRPPLWPPSTIWITWG